MDSSPVLRQQSQNKIRSELTRTKNENNKMPAHPKPSKLLSAHHLSNSNIENQDPVKSEMGRRAALGTSISRLPVLAKSLHLQTTSNFGLSNYKWEDKPLAGKTRRKKPCTRPVPFNFCQPKNSRLGHENQEPCTVSQSRTGTNADNSVCNSPLKTQNVNAKPTKNLAALIPNIDLNKGTGTFKGKAKDNALQTSATLFKPLSSIPNNAVPQSKEASAEPAVSAEACSDNMSLLSLKDPAKTSHATQNMQLTVQDPSSKSSTDKGDNFQSDHTALLSILRDEGLSATGLGSTTPHSKLYNNLPQRVPFLRSQHKLGPISGLMKSVQFSPDVAALQSILQNEGVKAGVPLGAIPRIPVCPGRGTSIIHAQRVPVRKNHAEATEGPVVLELKEIPQKQWTPQRVPCTRNRAMSAMKWPLSSSHRSSFAITPGLQRCKSTLKPQKEEIVQRLFYDQEEEHPEKRAEQLPTQNATAKAHHEVKVEASGVGTDKDEEEEQRIVGGQQFFQAPQRDSVIFFSTGKTLLRAPRFEKQVSSVRQEAHGPVLPVHEETRPVSACQINPAQSLHKDLISQKPSTQSSAVALLRKRLLALEELRMDEEVASYCSVPNAPCLLPPRPRCGNPLAYTLHFQESFTFVPIVFDLLSGCSSPSSSPLQER